MARILQWDSPPLYSDFLIFLCSFEGVYGVVQFNHMRRVWYPPPQSWQKTVQPFHDHTHLLPPPPPLPGPMLSVLSIFVIAEMSYDWSHPVCKLWGLTYSHSVHPLGSILAV